jgi:hypothetical protein
MATCRTCGGEFEQSGRGRPRKDCLTCRPKGSTKPVQKSVVPVDVAVLPPARHVVVSHHKFKPEDHPVAHRWCRICGRSQEAHA